MQKKKFSKEIIIVITNHLENIYKKKKIIIMPLMN